MHARLALLGGYENTDGQQSYVYWGEDYETQTTKNWTESAMQRKVVLFVGSVFGDGTGIVYAQTQLFWPDEARRTDYIVRAHDGETDSQFAHVTRTPRSTILSVRCYESAFRITHTIFRLTVKTISRDHFQYMNEYDGVWYIRMEH